MAGQVKYQGANLRARRFPYNKVGWDYDLGIGGTRIFNLLKKKPERLLNHARIVLADAGKLHLGNIRPQCCVTGDDGYILRYPQSVGKNGVVKRHGC